MLAARTLPAPLQRPQTPFQAQSGPMTQVPGSTARQRARMARRAYRVNHPDRRRAHEAVRRALVRGELVRGTCRCGAFGAVAHHPDYAEPLTVTWMCFEHHLGEHRFLRWLRTVGWA